MQEFLEKIYAIENFGSYILIAIGVLVIAFIIVLLMGKKDQKLEETKKLEALKKEVNEEAKEPKEEIKKEDMDILIPPPEKAEEVVVEEINTKLEDSTKEEIKEKLDNPLEDKEQESVGVFEFAPEKETKAPLEEVVVEPVIEPTPIPVAEPVIEPTPIPVAEPVIEPTPIPVTEPVEKPTPEPILEKEEIEIPEFNFDDLSSTLEEPKEVAKEVFSSVFVPEKEEPPMIRIVSPAEEIPKSSATEFDLPKLKEEDGFTFDQIEGEEYNINK